MLSLPLWWPTSRPWVTRALGAERVENLKRQMSGGSDRCPGNGTWGGHQGSSFPGASRVCSSALPSGTRGVCPVRRADPGAGCWRHPADPRPPTSGLRPETSVAEGHLCNLSARKVKDQESLKATGMLSEPHPSKHTPFPPQQVQGLTDTPGPTQLSFGEGSSR